MILIRPNPKNGIRAVKDQIPTKPKGKKLTPRYKEKEADICQNCERPVNECKGNCKIEK